MQCHGRWNRSPILSIGAAVHVVALSIGLVTLQHSARADWPRFRGPEGLGLAPQYDLPTTWNDANGKDANEPHAGGKHIAWKTRLPGRGCSCPLVIGDRVITTCSSGYRQNELHTLCFDAANGELRWHRRLWATGRTMTHPTISPAAPTPVSDGRHVFVSFSSNDVACFDLAGNLKWVRGLMIDYPNASNSLGLASSLVLADGVLVVKLENDSQSLTVGLDASDGRTIWKVDRVPKAMWTTPVVISARRSKRPAVVLQAADGLTAYDLRTADVVWRFDGGCSTQASTIALEDLLLVPSGGLTALQLDASGQPQVRWRNHRLRASVGTPLAYQGKVYVVSGTILKCGDLATGKLQWQIRLRGNKYSASPILGGKYLYTFAEDGTGDVIDLSGKKGKRIGGGKLDDKILATPAVGPHGLYVRGDHTLWCVR